MADHSQDRRDEPCKVIPLRGSDESMRIALIRTEESLSAFANDFQENSPVWVAINGFLVMLRMIIKGVAAEAIDDGVIDFTSVIELLNKIADDNVALRKLAETKRENPDHAAQAAELDQLRSDHAAQAAELDQLRSDHAAQAKKDNILIQTLTASLKAVSTELRESVIKANEGLRLEAELAKARVDRAEETARTFGRAQELVSALQNAAGSIAAGTAPPESVPSQAGISFSVLETEIVKRQKWCSELSGLMCELQAAKEGFQENVNTIDDKLALPETTQRGELTAERLRLIGEIAKIGRRSAYLIKQEQIVRIQLTKLERIKRQMTDLQEGTDLSFLGELLPDISSDEPETATTSNKPDASIPTVADSVLTKKAHEYGLTRAAFLAATLLDIALCTINPHTGSRYPNSKLYSLFDAAMSARIIQRFGWQSAKDVQHDVRGNDAQRAAFELYAKPVLPAATIICYETGNSLPWKWLDFLTEGEIRRFTNAIARKSKL